jgi:hypothetical protein
MAPGKRRGNYIITDCGLTAVVVEDFMNPKHITEPYHNLLKEATP